MPRPLDLTGQRFGRLVVIEKDGHKRTSGGNSKVCWKCICDCGNETRVSTGDLRSGSVMSCGCYNRDKIREPKGRKLNEYEFKNNYVIGKTSNKGTLFYVDLEDFEKIKEYTWALHHTGYIATHDDNHNWMLLHKLIMDDTENKYDIDHIKTEAKYDCRKNNLRIVTRSQNNSNKVLQKNNTSGVTGVHWDKSKKMWIAQIRKDKINYRIIQTKNYDEAVAARKEAEKKYFGEYSYENSQEEYSLLL